MRPCCVCPCYPASATARNRSTRPRAPRAKPVRRRFVIARSRSMSRSRSTTTTSSRPSSRSRCRSTPRSTRAEFTRRRNTSATSKSAYGASGRVTSSTSGPRARRGRRNYRASSCSWLSSGAELLGRSGLGRGFLLADLFRGFVDVVAECDRDPCCGPDDREERQPPGSLDAKKMVDRNRAWTGEHQRRRDGEVRERQLGATLIDPDRLVAVLLAPGDDHRCRSRDRTDRREEPEPGPSAAGDLRGPGHLRPVPCRLETDFLKALAGPFDTFSAQRPEELLCTMDRAKPHHNHPQKKDSHRFHRHTSGTCSCCAAR